MPHTGTHLPDSLSRRMTPEALALPDTDWHLVRLYDFLDELGASVLVATHSRYVVDLNRSFWPSARREIKRATQFLTHLVKNPRRKLPKKL